MSSLVKFLKSVEKQEFMQNVEGFLLKRIFLVHFVACELNRRYDIVLIQKCQFDMLLYVYNWPL